MNKNIDFAKSVRRNRLIFQGTRKQRFVLSLRSFLSGIFILLMFLALFLFAYYNNSDTFTLTLLALSALLVIVSMWLQNRLVRTKSTRIQDDQTAIFRFLLRKYPGIIRHNCSEQIIIITRPRRSFFNKEFLILQDGEHIYMNISTYSQGNLKYMFLSIPQYFTSRAVLKNFRRAFVRGAQGSNPPQQARAIV